MIYLTANGLTPGGSSTVHIDTQTIHRTQSKQTIHRTTQLTNWEECEPCTVFASYALAFALQPRKKHGKTSVRVAEECRLAPLKETSPLCCNKMGEYNTRLISQNTTKLFFILYYMYSKKATTCFGLF
jgi:hypothetical protein